jgi:hypothetical protein
VQSHLQLGYPEYVLSRRPWNLTGGANRTALLLRSRLGGWKSHNHVKYIDWVFVAEKKNLSSRTQRDRKLLATSSQCSTVTMLWEPQ